MGEFNRRTFLASTAAATVGFAARNTARAADANDTVVLALMGANNRGSQLATGFAPLKGVEIAYVCDCDERAIEKGIAAVTAAGGKKPQGIKDFRKALDDPAVDGLICAAPNHWHAAATILGCAAGKHVYVEKPACHTPDEGERMVRAARDAKRVVQVGLQRRSGPLYAKAMARIRDGAIGEVLYARSQYNADRPTIGHGKKTAVPGWLDYDLWQGPAPAKPFQDNVVHYNWHFFWHWGNGELGNNGVHTIDICRWALGVDYPSKVTASGSKIRYEDDQETPDTCSVTFDCDGKTMIWEGISWSRGQSASQIGIELRGDKGTLYIDDGGFAIHDPSGKIVEKETGARGDTEHLQNFVDAVRNGTRPNMDIEDGHKSTMFCHLGNIAYRTGQAIKVDTSNGHVLDNTAAEAFWSREYRDGWMPSDRA
jgi:predicted dehydrogenase